MPRFVLTLCTGTLALGLALALPSFSSAATPVNVASVAAVQPVGYYGYCYPRAYYRYGNSWRWHHHHHGYRHWHHRR